MLICCGQRVSKFPRRTQPSHWSHEVTPSVNRRETLSLWKGSCWMAAAIHSEQRRCSRRGSHGVDSCCALRALVSSSASPLRRLAFDAASNKLAGVTRPARSRTLPRSQTGMRQPCIGSCHRRLFLIGSTK
eukprot:7616987-Pyramimonas_sp.AAC.1